MDEPASQTCDLALPHQQTATCEGHAMTDFSGFVLEHSVDRGWHQFEAWLTDVLGKVEDGDVLVLSRESGPGESDRDHQPQVRFSAFAETRVRAEAPGNRQLDRQFTLSDEQQAHLNAIGFGSPSSA